MERIDKIISSQTHYTRKDVKELIRKKLVKVNGTIITKPEYKVNPKVDTIEVGNEKIEIKKYVYLMLNKPKGYVSATVDKLDKTVLELVPLEYSHRNIFPAGRLDKDTTGLMILTDDGEFAHDILSPKKHISKTYIATIDKPVTNEMIEGFKNGVNLIDGECKTAILEKLDTNKAKVILTEGRYHQIKRMFGCFGAKVETLHRTKMGNFSLPNDLNEGECREFNLEELLQVKENPNE